jgi:hypothetical protein
MRHKLFIEQSDALRFAQEVQQAVYATEASLEQARATLLVTGNIRIIPAWIEWMQRYSVPLVIEPVGMSETDVVDDINQPVVEMEAL